MQPVSEENEMCYRFGEYELDPVRRVLSKDGKVVALKPKILETLLVLVRNNGRLMDKDELMQEVWPDTVVEEVNLAHNISILRKVLGQRSEENRLIITVPGRGYRFVADVTQRKSTTSTAVSEYELTRSRLVVEDETSQGELPIATGMRNGRTSTVDLHYPKSKVGRLLERKGLLLAALVAIGVVAWLLINQSNTRKPQPSFTIKSIAVLPFKPLVAESRDESLEMGMADSLITRLSNIREINVRPVSAVRKYGGLEQDAAAAGREQKVDAVLDGSIQKSGDRIRITVRLIAVGDGATLWANTFDDRVTDIFTVQDSISERVAAALALRLTREERALVAEHYTNNADAYQLYLKGRYFWDKRNGDAIKKGIDYFNQAVNADPNYALAYAALAQSYVLLANYSDSTPQEAYSKARVAATKALELNDGLSEAHTALAYIRAGYDWDFAGAEREYRRAIELNPNYPTARNWYAEFIGLMGRSAESIAEMKRALELEPLSLIINLELGDMLFFAHQYDEAIEQYRKTLDLDPSFVRIHIQLGQFYCHEGKYEEAIAKFKKAIDLNKDDNYALQLLGYAHARLGRTDEAYKVLDELKERAKRTHVLPYDFAVIYVGLGEKDRAFEWLEKSFAERDEGLLYLKVDPALDSLRSDHRFADLMLRVGFPQ